jgi:hypothetical protein
MLLRSQPRRRGVVVLLVALALVFLIGMAAIALDGGLLLDTQRQAQAAADAGALAAATVLYHDRSADGTGANVAARQAAVDVVVRHGFTAEQVSVRLSPEAPEQASPTTTRDGQLRPGYAEVTVRKPQPRYFSRVWGTEAIPVSGRAVARGRFKPHGDGVLVLDLTAPRALEVRGGSSPPLNLMLTGDAQVVVNSQHSEGQGAAVVEGGASLSAAGGAVGGEADTGGGSVSIPGGFRQAPPSPDPLRDLPPIDPNALGLPVVGGDGTFTEDVTLTPGVYPTGINIQGGADESAPVTVTLSPGVYYIADGGLSVTGQANVVVQSADNGVLIYNASPGGSEQSGVNFAGEGTLHLTALNSGDARLTKYNGLTLFVDRGQSTPVNIAANEQTNVSGTVYAPGSPVTVSGDGDANIGSQYISRTLSVTGAGTLRINYDAGKAPRQRIVQLVE